MRAALVAVALLAGCEAAVTLPTCDPAVGRWQDDTWTLSKRYWSGYADAVRGECADMGLGVLQHDDGRCVYINQLCRTPDWPADDPAFNRDEGEPALEPCEPACVF